MVLFWVLGIGVTHFPTRHAEYNCRGVSFCRGRLRCTFGNLCFVRLHFPSGIHPEFHRVELSGPIGGFLRQDVKALRGSGNVCGFVLDFTGISRIVGGRLQSQLIDGIKETYSGCSWRWSHWRASRSSHQEQLSVWRCIAGIVGAQHLEPH